MQNFIVADTTGRKYAFTFDGRVARDVRALDGGTVDTATFLAAVRTCARGYLAAN